MVHELIASGHPDAARKLEGGVKAIQVGLRGCGPVAARARS